MLVKLPYDQQRIQGKTAGETIIYLVNVFEVSFNKDGTDRFTVQMCTVYTHTGMFVSGLLNSVIRFQNRPIFL